MAEGLGTNFGRIDIADRAKRLDIPLQMAGGTAARNPLPAMDYRRIRENEKGDFYQTVVNYLVLMAQTKGVEAEPENWDREWGQVLSRVQESGVSLETLRPD